VNVNQSDGGTTAAGDVASLLSGCHVLPLAAASAASGLSADQRTYVSELMGHQSKHPSASGSRRGTRRCRSAGSGHRPTAAAGRVPRLRRNSMRSFSQCCGHSSRAARKKAGDQNSPACQFYCQVQHINSNCVLIKQCLVVHNNCSCDRNYARNCNFAFVYSLIRRAALFRMPTCSYFLLHSIRLPHGPSPVLGHHRCDRRRPSLLPTYRSRYCLSRAIVSSGASAWTQWPTPRIVVSMWFGK
jgi:hypothetical protein